MIEYTSLDISKRLAEAGFKAEADMQHQDIAIGDKIKGLPHVREFALSGTPAYRADILLSWLLSHGDSIEITPDLDGFNVTYWVKHNDYNGINIFLCDALGEVILAVMAREAKHD